MVRSQGQHRVEGIAWYVLESQVDQEVEGTCDAGRDKDAAAGT